jgi:hypothetical protein
MGVSAPLLRAGFRIFPAFRQFLCKAASRQNLLLSNDIELTMKIRSEKALLKRPFLRPYFVRASAFSGFSAKPSGKMFFAVRLSLFIAVVLFHGLPQKAFAQSTQTRFCEVHGESLKQARVKIIYGHFDLDSEWLENTSFPHSNQYILRGCAQISDIRADGSCEKKSGAKYEDVYYCEKCREAENAWLRAKGKKYKPFVRLGIPY